MAAVISQFWRDSVHASILLTERSALSGIVYLCIADGILSTKKIRYQRQDLIAAFIGWKKTPGLMKHEAIVPVNNYLCTHIRVIAWRRWGTDRLWISECAIGDAIELYNIP